MVTLPFFCIQQALEARRIHRQCSWVWTQSTRLTRVLLLVQPVFPEQASLWLLTWHREIPPGRLWWLRQSLGHHWIYIKNQMGVWTPALPTHTHLITITLGSSLWLTVLMLAWGRADQPALCAHCLSELLWGSLPSHKSSCSSSFCRQAVTITNLKFLLTIKKKIPPSTSSLL